MGESDLDRFHETFGLQGSNRMGKTCCHWRGRWAFSSESIMRAKVWTRGSLSSLCRSQCKGYIFGENLVSLFCSHFLIAYGDFSRCRDCGGASASWRKKGENGKMEAMELSKDRQPQLECSFGPSSTRRSGVWTAPELMPPRGKQSNL